MELTADRIVVRSYPPPSPSVDTRYAQASTDSASTPTQAYCLWGLLGPIGLHWLFLSMRAKSRSSAHVHREQLRYVAPRLAQRMPNGRLVVFTSPPGFA